MEESFLNTSRCDYGFRGKNKELPILILEYDLSGFSAKMLNFFKIRYKAYLPTVESHRFSGP